MSLPTAFSLWMIHPALVHFPIAFWLGGIALDVFAWARERCDGAEPKSSTQALFVPRIATGLLIAGSLTAVPALLSGLAAYFTFPIAGRGAATAMNSHLVLQLVAFGIFSWVAFVRWLDRDALPSGPLRVAGLLAAVLLVAGSYLGGYLVYHAAGFVPP